MLKMERRHGPNCVAFITDRSSFIGEVWVLSTERRHAESQRTEGSMSHTIHGAR
jgi:hypothetical protein